MDTRGNMALRTLRNHREHRQRRRRRRSGWRQVEEHCRAAPGGDPKFHDAADLFRIDGAPTLLSITYTKSKAAKDLTILVVESPDCTPGSWMPAFGSATLLSEDAGRERFRFTRPARGEKQLFLRLEVTGQ